jgi:hypothetical protein
MKKLIFLMLMISSFLGLSAQSSSTSPGNGHWVVIDSGYQVGTTTSGQTVAPLHFYNTGTSEKITGMQFRVFYDNTAFTKVVPSLKISSTDQYLQYTDSNASGQLTVTVVYTGSSSSFSYSNGATFDLTFTHASSSTWNNLDSIKTLKVKGARAYNNLASTIWANDTTLVVYSYGGRFNQRVLRFAGKFINVTGTDAKNLWISLEKKPKTGGSWVTVASDKTNYKGHVVFRKFLDTTYWDTRMVVKGDTMTPGSVFSTADAQKINQVLLSSYTPIGFDFYTMDVNGTDGSITISDVYSVYGRLSGRFTSWTKGIKDVLFFTESEYAQIISSTSNKTGVYSGTNNFTYYINGKDSITYYVAVKGDANATGFKMARLTPIKITNPANAKNYIIDETVRYDNVLQEIEVNMPSVKVDQGNLVQIPVKVFTNGTDLGALQLDLKYDTSLLEFKAVKNSEKMFKWTTYMNPSNGIVSWGGSDLTNSNLLKDGEEAFTLQFVAKRPQDEWGSAALWTGAKYVGDAGAKDMNIRPTNGVVEVRRILNPIKIKDLHSLIVFPNPTEGEIQFEFQVENTGDVHVNVKDLVGREVLQILNTQMPSGKYTYLTNLSHLSNGFYILSIQTITSTQQSKIIISK